MSDAIRTESEAERWNQLTTELAAEETTLDGQIDALDAECQTARERQRRELLAIEERHMDRMRPVIERIQALKAAIDREQARQTERSLRDG